MVFVPVLERTTVGVAGGRRCAENNLAATVGSVVLALALFTVSVANVIRISVRGSRGDKESRRVDA